MLALYDMDKSIEKSLYFLYSIVCTYEEYDVITSWNTIVTDHSLLDFTTAERTFLGVQMVYTLTITRWILYGKKSTFPTKNIFFYLLTNSNTQQWWHWYIMTNTSSSDNQYINRFIMPWIFIFLQVSLSLMMNWCIYHRQH